MHLPPKVLITEWVALSGRSFGSAAPSVSLYTILYHFTSKFCKSGLTCLCFIAQKSSFSIWVFCMFSLLLCYLYITYQILSLQSQRFTNTWAPWLPECPRASHHSLRTWMPASQSSSTLSGTLPRTGKSILLRLDGVVIDIFEGYAMENLSSGLRMVLFDKIFSMQIQTCVCSLC